MLECPICESLTAYVKETKRASAHTFFCPTCKTRYFFHREVRDLFHATIIRFVNQIKDAGRAVMLNDPVRPVALNQKSAFCLVCGKKTCIAAGCKKPGWVWLRCQSCTSTGFMTAKSMLTIL